MQQKLSKSTKPVHERHSGIELRYGLDDRLPARETALYAMQWLAMSLPFIVIVGAIAATHHSNDSGLRTLYLQKTTFATGLMLFGQALLGHRLTLVSGPATVLLLGILESRTGPDAIYTAIAVCGTLLAIVSAAGLFSALRTIFTSRVTATVVLLIAFTMTPMIVELLTVGDAGTCSVRLAFASGFVLALFLAHRLLPPAVRALLIVAGMAAGTALFSVIFGINGTVANQETIASFFSGITTPVFDIGTILSFFFCFIALSLNEIGSIQAITPLLRPDGMDGRVRRGMTLTGAVNAVAGLLGVIGPIDYSLSPGVIAASGCGSRFPLIPAAIILLLASFSPAVLSLAGIIPPAVVGSVLIYTLSGQISSGLTAAFNGKAFTFEDGMVIGLPLLAGTVTTQLPAALVDTFPAILRPMAGNGFVVGVIAVLILDRIFHRPVR
ncbi:xanthine permease [Candidatus Methylospira mobilis]|uniref:Xanthine permease n=1 Tax=Candidatus Methylospira mobilis TaxID=1808979 RepID=A0A5Q0BR72_9GAMM|nr:solute carrier family 23 protein [Candidatus Methylospira mobilis]QFY44694.1 xanthine permease [Candidatus Methylospira mobilis]